MKLIDVNDYNMRLSGRDEINIDEMSDEVKNYYFRLYSLYMDLFVKYLINKTIIKEYDNKIDSYNLRFVKCESNDLDFYQNFSSEYLNYYYLRNNLYIYRLSQEENDFLKNILISKNFELTEDVIKFIENTFRKVIFEKVNDEEITNVNYGPDYVLNLASNDSIVIGVRYNEYDNGLDNEEWMDNYLKQKKILEKDSLELSKHICNILGCSCAVFEYTDDSVKKKSDVANEEENINLGL